ncbi:MAG: DUF924 family protein [Vulcanococcus sp.]|jgi:uncharacterized protein (DUF924 family)
MSPGHGAESVVQFWFTSCKPRQWFRRSNAFDALIRERFGGLTEAAAAGGLCSWESEPTSALALVLLLDQFSRQIWRDQARAFNGDARALGLSQRALELGWIAAEPERVRRQFWLMPQLHSERLEVVEASLGLFERFSDPATTAVARRHADLLRRFGRYPHRNAALGRRSTPEELAFLQPPPEPGATFRCDGCQASGPIHYRVSTASAPDWQLVCPQCWTSLRAQPGYRYGGTRKANRRQRS